MKRHQIAIILTTAVLVIYTLMTRVGVPLLILSIIFALLPVLTIWMVYEILYHAPYDGPELRDGEEYGYSDRQKSQLGMF